MHGDVAPCGDEEVLRGIELQGDNDLLLCREDAAARRRPLQVRAQWVGEEHNARATESKALLQFVLSNPSKGFKRSRNTRCRPLITTAYWANTRSLRCRRRVTVDIASLIFANPSANQLSVSRRASREPFRLLPLRFVHRPYMHNTLHEVLSDWTRIHVRVTHSHPRSPNTMEAQNHEHIIGHAAALVDRKETNAAG
ncbi:hypothetical protein ISCGN_010805 [Ixodes scapularis]